MRHPIDIATMFAALWLLGSMVVDVLTPKELTVYMIAAATAPAVIGTGLSASRPRDGRMGVAPGGHYYGCHIATPLS